MAHMWAWLKAFCSLRYEGHLKCKGTLKNLQWKCKHKIAFKMLPHGKHNFRSFKSERCRRKEKHVFSVAEVNQVTTENSLIIAV